MPERKHKKGVTHSWESSSESSSFNGRTRRRARSTSRTVPLTGRGPVVRHVVASFLRSRSISDLENEHQLDSGKTHCSYFEISSAIRGDLLRREVTGLRIEVVS